MSKRSDGRTMTYDYTSALERVGQEQIGADRHHSARRSVTDRLSRLRARRQRIGRGAGGRSDRYDYDPYGALQNQDELSARASVKRNTGTTVLGHYPEYVKVSDTVGARRFDVSEAAWKRMAPDEQWAANQRFLDRTIARGDDIQLATPIDRARSGSFYEREPRYLTSKGFRPNQQGDRLMAPGG